jgi:hypothetical protein
LHLRKAQTTFLSTSRLNSFCGIKNIFTSIPVNPEKAAYNETLVMLNSKSVPAAETVGASVQVMQLYPGQSKSRYI